MKPKLLLLSAPSGTGKTTVARLLVATDQRFKHVQVMTTRTIREDEIGRSEKKYVDLEELIRMKDHNMLANFNQKDGVYYGISYEAIASIIRSELFPVLEWDIKRISYWDEIFPVYKVILMPSSVETVMRNLNDGRDVEGKRRTGVLNELEEIENGSIQGDIVIKNYNHSVMDTVQKLRKAILG